MRARIVAILTALALALGVLMAPIAGAHWQSPSHCHTYTHGIQIDKLLAGGEAYGHKVDWWSQSGTNLTTARKIYYRPYYGAVWYYVHTHLTTCFNPT